MAAVLPALRMSGLAMLLTLTRRQETALACWRDVNMEARTWTIPETKNGEMHVVPLVPAGNRLAAVPTAG